MALTQGAVDFLKALGLFVGGVGSLGIGKWLFDYMRFRSAREDRRGVEQRGRETSMIAEYQKIIDAKDKDHDRDRLQWERELARKEEESKQKDREIAAIRRQDQQMMLDQEGMRVRIHTLDREMARLAGDARVGVADILDAVVFADADGEIYWANESTSLFLKIPLEQLHRMNVREFIPPALRPAHEAGLERLRRRGPAPRGMVSDRIVRARALLRDGSEIPADIYLSTFTFKGETAVRAQLRRRYDRPGDTDSEIPYIPPNASASTSAIVQAPPVPPDRPERRKDDGRKKFR
jgi:PAS domain-containing protein